jgi:hypothetical protein
MNEPASDGECQSTSVDACGAAICPDGSKARAVPGARGTVALRERRPFVAQDGQTLYLVAGDTGGWVVAELQFEPDSCTFTLLRQAEYQWPREALGRLLSRMMAAQPGEEEIIRLSDAFAEWLAGQFAT